MLMVKCYIWPKSRRRMKPWGRHVDDLRTCHPSRLVVHAAHCQDMHTTTHLQWSQTTVKKRPQISTGRRHSTCSPAPATRPRTAPRSRRRGPTSAAAPAWTASSGTAPAHVVAQGQEARAEGAEAAASRWRSAPVHGIAIQIAGLSVPYMCGQKPCM